MTLAVGHGYELPYLLDLPITAFNALVDSILRVKKQALAEAGWVVHYAAQYEKKALKEYLGAVTGETDRESKAEHSLAREQMNRQGAKPRGLR